MSNLPKKVTERLIKELSKFQSILKNAKDRDINESDTVTIIKDILSSVFGFDKYTEITSEYCIRGTYCDLAVKIDGNLKYLIEVKAIGLDLKTSHLQQALNYGANQGINWVILTNGLIWDIYRIKFEKPIQADKVCTLDFLTLNARKKDDQEKLYLLCKEGISKAAIEDYHERLQTVNRFTIAAILSGNSGIDLIRKELKKLSPGLKVEPPEIETILKNEVLKREVIEGEAAQKSMAKIKRSAAKAARKNATTKAEVSQS